MTQVIRTKMATALIGAAHDAIEKKGRNLHWLGRVILTNEAKGVGVKWRGRPQQHSKIAA